MKKAAPQPLTKGSFDPDSEIASRPSGPIFNQESMSDSDVANISGTEHDDAKDMTGLVLSGETISLVFSFTVNILQCD